MHEYLLAVRILQATHSPLHIKRYTHPHSLANYAVRSTAMRALHHYFAIPAPQGVLQHIPHRVITGVEVRANVYGELPERRLDRVCAACRVARELAQDMRGGDDRDESALYPQHSQFRAEDAGGAVEVLVAECRAEGDLLAAPHGVFQAPWAVGFVFADAEARFAGEFVHEEGCSSAGVRVSQQVLVSEVLRYVDVQLIR
ncbi:hypothetical protein N0V87_008833 [Didymella glomerata]|uniref:Uncharacterized protein n=1 Tax=Didymella glomerata TaxID=749621 RepID=A0A9W8WST7_9PLEO|nr:hypothetical protein N0V87_008833 [Didymella glomerata]